MWTSIFEIDYLPLKSQFRINPLRIISSGTGSYPANRQKCWHQFLIHRNKPIHISPELLAYDEYVLRYEGSPVAWAAVCSSGASSKKEISRTNRGTRNAICVDESALRGMDSRFG
jgi:hypothetical protein